MSAAATCAILIGLIGSQSVPGLRTAWFNGQIAPGLDQPERGEIASFASASDGWTALFAPDARDLGPADCSPEFERHGVAIDRRPPTPRDARGNDVWPDGRPSVTFGQIRVSRAGDWALVTWWSFMASLWGSHHYAIVHRRAGGWHTVAHGQFGAIA